MRKYGTHLSYKAIKKLLYIVKRINFLKCQQFIFVHFILYIIKLARRIIYVIVT